VDVSIPYSHPAENNFRGQGEKISGISQISQVFCLEEGVASSFRPQASGTDTAGISFISTASNSPTVESMTGSGVLSRRSFLEPEHICCRGLQHLPQWRFRWTVREDQLRTQCSTGYTDNTVQAGVTYYYVTTAVDASGVESVYSNQAQAVVPTP
jgi:hypothetical protein